ncbi:MAG: hypothetical protein ACTIOI_13215, partial [Pseudomonas helleri]|uniref:hypothetical protein n=1 Tax=Pseudomonas helleri TaxID=1608996 RepID=UPI003F972919
KQRQSRRYAPCLAHHKKSDPKVAFFVASESSRALKQIWRSGRDHDSSSNGLKSRQFKKLIYRRWTELCTHHSALQMTSSEQISNISF